MPDLIFVYGIDYIFILATLWPWWMTANSEFFSTGFNEINSPHVQEEDIRVVRKIPQVLHSIGIHVTKPRC